jgi:hypothetical protein
LKTEGAYPLTVLPLTCSQITHDFEHKGVNNEYLIKSNDELALRYNDRR